MSARKPVPTTATATAIAAASAATAAPAPAAPPTAVAAADATPATTEPTADNPETGSVDLSQLVEVRVLSAFDGHAPNDVIEITAEEASSLGAAVDASPAAVAYAKSLKA